MPKKHTLKSQGRKMYHLKPAQTICFFILIAFVNLFQCLSALEILTHGSSISVERRSSDTIVSPDGTFSAGFQSVGDNAYCFAIWFTKSANFTPVWMANRDQPVNGRHSALLLRKGGNLVLLDAGKSIIWETGTSSTSLVHLRLLNTGNLIMLQTSTNTTLWQSFDGPTDTLLPQQQFTKNLKLVSSRSQSNYSSGFYTFFFDDDNLLRLRYEGPNVSSIYWYDPFYKSWEMGRTTYNSIRIAMFDLSGQFRSSDELSFLASDFGLGTKRRLTLDYDGNLRLYSLNEKNGSWMISWMALSQHCKIHGLCGPNGVCVYGYDVRRCSCPPGFKMKDPKDWSQGCQPTFNISHDPLESTFITAPHTNFYGYDVNYTDKISFQACMDLCLKLDSCKAFMYSFEGKAHCYPKALLLNGYQSPDFNGMMHIKVPKNMILSGEDPVQLKPIELNCDSIASIQLARRYLPTQENNSLKYLSWFAYAFGGFELICLAMACWFTIKGPSATEKGYVNAATHFKRFNYAELKKATKNFGEVIGRGGGVVYKGELPDERVVAVKQLEGVNQGEEEFLAEVSIIGRINHMNLIQGWGFCAERKHRC